MTKREAKANVVDLKARVERDADYLCAVVQPIVQARCKQR
jgi:hypothetical protein